MTLFALAIALQLLATVEPNPCQPLDPADQIQCTDPELEGE